MSPSIIRNMTKTFMELVKLADFKTEAPQEAIPEALPQGTATETGEASAITGIGAKVEPSSQAAPTLVYRIEIVLPAVRDQAIYDAIFRSAKEHLLK